MFSLFPIHGVLEIGLILVLIAVLVEISDKSFKNEFLPGTGNEFTSISENLHFFADGVGHERLIPLIGVVKLVTDLQKSCGFSFCKIRGERKIKCFQMNFVFFFTLNLFNSGRFFIFFALLAKFKV